MKRSTLNDTKLGDTNPRGRWRSPLLGHYARSMPSGREEKNQPLNFCRLRRQTAPWYTLNEDQRTEREVRNCPPKRVRSRTAQATAPNWDLPHGSGICCGLGARSARIGLPTTWVGIGPLWNPCFSPQNETAKQ